MFKRILIANRGEIACRIIRTARRLGIEMVAVYSDADEDALHVAMADEAVRIGPAAASQSYLSIDAIVAACKRTGAEAVHPGYGFLSERADFPRALAKAGLVFIGPHADAIDAMGDKIAAKLMAEKAGVATVPGFHGVVADVIHAQKIAIGVGYPVMIKAAAGGGGKGLRIAHDKKELAEGLERARSEAKSSFGDDRVFIEKYIENPRHIEIQVLGDKHGNVIHLGERDCSIQRRNQKVVEEAPSPALDATTRNKMGMQAVALAKAAGYDSAGTVEFVVGRDKRFYFLEMNTRLQVEHPVTELVTGIDLVEQMIRVAAGETLAIRQSDVKLNGHAVETRIYAEDPYRNFLPSIGRLTRYRPPEEGTHDGVTVRVDTGVAEGSEISIHYDPMIAKLITHAPDRTRAIAAQSDALDAFAIDGIRHNIPFLAALMQRKRWRAGNISTGFIAEEFPDGFHPQPPTGEIAIALATAAVAIDCRLSDRRRRISGQRPDAVNGEERQCVVRLGEAEIAVEVERRDGQLTLRIGGKQKRHGIISNWKPGDSVWTGLIDGRAVNVRVRPVLNGFDLSHRGIEVRAQVLGVCEAQVARLMPRRTAVDGGKAVRCPMPGQVVSIAVVEGQEVRAGETLAVVEAMKMENVLRAERDGMVKTIRVKAGDSLAVDAVILEFA
jgi:propionyl-CoA carboxylase alpha chain